MSEPIRAPQRRPSSSSATARSLGISYRSHPDALAIAEESIARDLSDNPDLDRLSRPTSYDNHPPLTEHSLVSSYRRASYIASGPRPFLGSAVQQPASVVPGEQEWEDAIGEERSLLRDNGLIPAKHERRRESETDDRKSIGRKASIPGFGIPRRKPSRLRDSETTAPEDPTPTEETSLLHTPNPDDPESYAAAASNTEVAKKWESAVLSGEIDTTWQRESHVLFTTSLPLVITFILQNSLTLTSVFTVGHIGKTELGAVSLGSMTANITGYAVYHGLATSLDTLCAQAYGSGRKELVGLQLQRMVWFLWVVTIPIAIIWACGGLILSAIVPEKEIAHLAGLYLRILILGAPGRVSYAAFESGKRYVQAQSRFRATLYVLLLCAPLNILLHYLFVFHTSLGFLGCPLAVILTENLMPLLLFLYVRFSPGALDCWPGFSRAAFKNWGPMVRLALPGLVMVLAEFLAFEILTLSSSWISATHLAANTVLQSLSVLTYQLPFPVSIAASTRVANLIGAGLPKAARTTGKVAFVVGGVLGCFNMVVLMSCRGWIPWLFTSDDEVSELASKVLPVNAAFQLFDALAAICNGMLRGLGKQEIGGWVSLIAYYAVAMPISFGTAFGLHWDLYGLWAGPAVALALVSGIEGVFIWRTSWQKASEEAATRNAAG